MKRIVKCILGMLAHNLVDGGRRIAMRPTWDTQKDTVSKTISEHLVY